MKKALSILAIVCILGMGCSTVGMKGIHEIGTEIDFYGTVRTFMDDWPAISGAIDSLFAQNYGEFKVVAFEAKRDLDDLSFKKEGNPDYVFTKRELGKAWGCAEILLQTAIKASLQVFYPEAFNMIPAVLL